MRLAWAVIILNVLSFVRDELDQLGYIPDPYKSLTMFVFVVCDSFFFVFVDIFFFPCFLKAWVVVQIFLESSLLSFVREDGWIHRAIFQLLEILFH